MHHVVGKIVAKQMFKQLAPAQMRCWVALKQAEQCLSNIKSQAFIFNMLKCILDAIY